MVRLLVEKYDRAVSNVMQTFQTLSRHGLGAWRRLQSPHSTKRFGNEGDGREEIMHEHVGYSAAAFVGWRASPKTGIRLEGRRDNLRS